MSDPAQEPAPRDAPRPAAPSVRGRIRRYALAVEALAAVMTASLLTRLPARRFFRLYRLQRCPPPAPDPPVAGDGAAEAARIGRAVARVAGLVPVRAVCLQQSLATHRMLRRRGFGPVIHFGVRLADHPEAGGDDPALPDTSQHSAHAWVVVGGAVVNGDRGDLGDFAVVGAYR